MTVPFAFANLSGNIALAKLDSNFNTPITIGNTSVLLGNTVTTLNNLTLANVTITSGTSNVTNVNVTNITVTNLTATLANVSTLNVSSASITSANIGTLVLTNSLSVPNGGTGQVTFPANSVLVGNGTGGIATVAPGNVGNVLTSIGGAWVSNAVVTNAAAGSNTQIQYNNAGALAGSANFVFDGTNVGIGTSSPGAKLDVVGSTVDVIMRLGNGTSQARYAVDNDGPYIYALTSGDNALRVFTPAGSQALTIDSSGNLGIGTSSPQQKFVVSNSGAAGVEVSPSGGSQGGTYLQAYNRSGTAFVPTEIIASKIGFYTGASPAFAALLDSSGNLGIGTTSPSASAILDAQSTTKGVRMPNMTTTQKNAISSPAAGLMVFDTTLAKLCVYSGSAWQTITSV